jgi:predicted TIM-barrel fold metal-dependent hydrolase
MNDVTSRRTFLAAAGAVAALPVLTGGNAMAASADDEAAAKARAVDEKVRFPQDPMYGKYPHEEPIDPALPMVDPHRHMYDVPGDRHLFFETVETLRESGHNFTHTVFIEAHQMYRDYGPLEMRPVGEVEFANGTAAMAASGVYGPCLISAAIIGHADVRIGAPVKAVLEAEIAAGNGRFRGIRAPLSDHNEFLEYPPGTPPPADDPLTGTKSLEGLKALSDLGLIYNAGARMNQLGTIAKVAAALPNLRIVLDHMGHPFDMAPSRMDSLGKRKEYFATWSRNMAQLVKYPNIVVKVGCLAMNVDPPPGTHRAFSSEELEEQWRPPIERVFELFGIDRCMFEGDGAGFGSGSVCAYGTLWNAFKRITAKYSPSEKEKLFSANARKYYRIGDNA